MHFEMMEFGRFAEIPIIMRRSDSFATPVKDTLKRHSTTESLNSTVPQKSDINY